MMNERDITKQSHGEAPSLKEVARWVGLEPTATGRGSQSETSASVPVPGPETRASRPRHWLPVTKTDRRAIGLAAGHYSTQKPYSRELGPPGQKLVFLTLDCTAVWGSHRPAPWTGLKRMDGFEGHGNFLFRNTGSFLASDLIREAVGLTAVVWGVAPFITYVAVDKVRSTNPGYCYILAGFKRVGYGHSQKHGKMARLEMDESEVRRCWLEEVLR